MRILYIAISCDPYNGSEDQIGWQVPWECSKTEEVFVVTRTDLKPSIDLFLSKNEIRKIQFIYVDMPKMAQKLFKGTLQSLKLLIWNKKAYIEAKNVCKNNNIDIIHQITPIEYRSIGRFNEIKNIKSVCGPIGAGQNIPDPLMCYVKGKNKINEYVRSIVNSLFRKKIIRRIKKYDYVLFTNPETLDYLDGNKLNGRTELIYDNGICECELNAEKVNEYHKKRIENLRNDVVKLLIAGRLIYIKGHDFLFDVLEMLPQNIEYELRVVGDGELRKHIEERALSTNLNGKVKVIGSVPYTMMNSEYSEANALVFCSLRESSGTVILEAMKNGLPIISLNRFGASLILDNQNAWLVNGEDIEAYKQTLYDSLIECIQNPTVTVEKGRYAFKKAQELTWTKKVERYKEIYHCIMKD